MRRAVTSRVAVAAMVALLASTATAFADTAKPDGDLLPGGQVELGEVSPGAVLPVSVGLTLTCSGSFHVDQNQTATLVPASYTFPAGGGLTADGATLGPPPVSWPADGDGCGAAPSVAPTPSAATITAPMTPGEYSYTILYSRTLAPTGGFDAKSFATLSGVTFLLTVVDNTPPVLTLPADSTVEGDTTGGAIAAYEVSATDAQDDPGPVPTCDPEPGQLLPLGENAIDCSVTDSGNLSSTGTFRITVVDTTPPAFSGSLPDLTEGTSDPSGMAVSWPARSALDVVDPTPSVGCLPASGSTFPIGQTVVTCTATDASGNAATTAFNVTVHHDTAVFGPPVGPTLDVRVTRGRTLPVKVELFRDDSEVESGAAELEVAQCDGAGPSGGPVALRWQADAGRWFALLDTSILPDGGCQRVTVELNGEYLGSFTLRLDRLAVR